MMNQVAYWIGQKQNQFRLAILLSVALVSPLMRLHALVSVTDSTQMILATQGGNANAIATNQMRTWGAWNMMIVETINRHREVKSAIAQ